LRGSPGTFADSSPIEIRRQALETLDSDLGTVRASCWDFFELLFTATPAIAKVEAAEKAAQGGRGKPIIEYMAFEVFDTLLGSEKALKMFFYGIKRVRGVGNLGIGISGPGLGCAAGVRRLSDSEFALHRDEVGLMIRGVRPRFPTCVVTEDRQAGLPHVAFVPRPPSREAAP
jgi:hypothetical protein